MPLQECIWERRGKVVVAGAGGVEGGEIVFGMYCIKESIFNIKGKIFILI